jgi:uncharacterized protein
MPKNRRQANRTSATGKEVGDSLEQRYVKALHDKSDADASDALPTVSERQTLGNTPASWMVVEISPDGLQAVLRRISFGGDSTLTSRDIAGALADQYYIEDGIDQDLLAQVAERALADPHAVVTGNFAVARGMPAVPGHDGCIEYSFSAAATVPPPSFGRLQEAFAQPTIESVLASDAPGILVAPGQQLARLIPASPGTAGRDIYGHRIEKPGANPALKTGPHVRQEGAHFFSTIFGYVCLIDSELSVIPPMWISSDNMKAYFIHFPQVAPLETLEPQWLRDTLAALGVECGLVEKNIAEICRRPLAAHAKKALLLARGTAPQAGVDTHLEFSFDLEKRAGKILPDGSIDLRERNSVISVEEGQLLGTVVQATRGAPGTDLLGTVLVARDGKDALAVAAGENVRTEGDPPTTFYAATNGHVHVGPKRIDVKPVFVVSGDVDYEVGNIDTQNDVQVNGNIKSGFTVKAGGSISISGTVESGAVLSARGDIIIAHGIIGEGAKVTAQGILSMGKVQTQFIQNATVMSRGDIEVGSYIFNSRVRAGGKITVSAGGGERGGSIVGGEVLAASHIACQVVGSPTTSGTRMGIGLAPELRARLAKVDKTTEFCDSNTIRLLRTLGLQTVDAQRLKAIVRQAPATKKQVLSEVIKKLYDLLDIREKAIAEKEKLQKALEATLADAEIDVARTLYAGVQLVMGDSELAIRSDRDGSRFRLQPTGIQSLSDN